MDEIFWGVLQIFFVEGRNFEYQTNLDSSFIVSQMLSFVRIYEQQIIKSDYARFPHISYENRFCISSIN